mmetsp:Transcript_16110/g.19077  ORF Transcript_16110/g.19077 Transcript_16110/m.19077 type:complete len:145 (-) Transcript_16110:46-480(-)|eukprot:CAMPEP_0198254728 /NCGR_PEP_ID=MMETSP1447-20131203/5004_1 /TAXON_ID=420782 /ORGANISM="Chaetoceros dichaeta, Strain CCMP1751" /LENGTH=144 /DNA_ID=CAMNT_0043940899 /DNA_START=78 /DNA_END=512 /DNA_ORIENTATION=+
MAEAALTTATMQMEQSLTGAIELHREAASLSADGHTIGALQFDRRGLSIRLYHLDAPPFVAPIDVAFSHRAVAGDLVKIIEGLNGANETLSTKHRAEALDHYYTAFTITQDTYGNDSILTNADWELFMSMDPTNEELISLLLRI